MRTFKCIRKILSFTPGKIYYDGVDVGGMRGIIDDDGFARVVIYENADDPVNLRDFHGLIELNLESYVREASKI